MEFYSQHYAKESFYILITFARNICSSHYYSLRLLFIAVLSLKIQTLFTIFLLIKTTLFIIHTTGVNRDMNHVQQRGIFKAFIIIQKYICILMLMTIYECNYFLNTHSVTCIFIIETVHVWLDFTNKNLYTGVCRSMLQTHTVPGF